MTEAREERYANQRAHEDFREPAVYVADERVQNVAAVELSDRQQV